MLQDIQATITFHKDDGFIPDHYKLHGEKVSKFTNDQLSELEKIAIKRAKYMIPHSTSLLLKIVRIAERSVIFVEGGLRKERGRWLPFHPCVHLIENGTIVGYDMFGYSPLNIG